MGGDGTLAVDEVTIVEVPDVVECIVGISDVISSGTSIDVLPFDGCLEVFGFRFFKFLKIGAYIVGVSSSVTSKHSVVFVDLAECSGVVLIEVEDVAVVRDTGLGTQISVE